MDEAIVAVGSSEWRFVSFLSSSRNLAYACRQDWVHDLAMDVKGKGRDDGSRRLNSKAAAIEESAKRDAELRALYVVVPPGDEAKPISCPICKEHLKSEFLEDDEDWVWKNAVKKDDRVRRFCLIRICSFTDIVLFQIYHATCHAEAVASTNSLAARLRTEMTTGRSRSGTPEASSMSGAISLSLTRSTPPPTTLRDSLSKSPSRSPSVESKLAGTKRKVETNSTSSSGELDGTPPLKKLALAPSPLSTTA